MRIKNVVQRAMRKSSANELVYTFTKDEVGIESTSPKSTFGMWIVSAMGGVSMGLTGVVMTATPTAEWSIPLLVASAVSFATPVGIGRSRLNKFSAKLKRGINDLLPKIIFGTVPTLTDEQAVALSKGRTVTLPLTSGGDVTIKLGRDILESIGHALTTESMWDGDGKSSADKAFKGGTIYLSQPLSGAAEFHALLENVKAEDPAVRKAVEAAEARKALESSAQHQLRNVASAMPGVIRSYLNPPKKDTQITPK